MPTITIEGRQANISQGLLSTLNDLDSCRPGGIATVHNHVSGTPGKDKCIRSRRSTINFISKFHYTRLVRRWRDAAASVELSDVSLDDKAAAQFNKAKEELLASYDRTLGETAEPVNEGHREGHVRCYLKSSAGIKCHLVTEYGEVNGRKVKVPVLAENGLPTVQSIMVSVLQLHQTIHDEGEYKPTKSQAKTIAKNAIKAIAEGVAPKFKMLSLKGDNFDKLTIDGECVTPDQLKGNVQLIEAEEATV